jgi:hypothetical protein
MLSYQRRLNILINCENRQSIHKSKYFSKIIDKECLKKDIISKKYFIEANALILTK